MMRIGLTGGIASGKSTIAAALKNAHIPVVDADELARRVVEKGSLGLAAVIAAFGAQLLSSDGTLDRKKLGDLVFSDPALLIKLEAIIHPKIEEEREKIFSHLAGLGHDVVVYMAPLLFEKNLQRHMDKTLLIVAYSGHRRERMIKRDNLSEKDIENRLKSQLPDESKIPLADEIIENNGSLKDLLEKLSKAWMKLTGKVLFLE